jgi:hypothetical protein
MTFSLPSRRPRPVRPVLGAAVIMAVVALAACGSPKSPTHAAVPSTTATTHGVTPTTTPGSTAPVATAGAVTATLRVVVCPTTYGVTQAPAPPLPATLTVEVPAGQANALAVYTDGRGTMKLLAPAGWACRATYGADGSGGVAVYPPGGALSADAFGAGWSLPAGSPVEAVVGSETSACQGCGLGQACPLFPAAAVAFQSEFGRACPTARPDGETVDHLGAGVVAFGDPPGVAGDGSPSGGAYPANGVETFPAAGQSGSWIDTCTLPTSDKSLCTTVLNNFLTQYGQD